MLLGFEFLFHQLYASTTQRLKRASANELLEKWKGVNIYPLINYLTEQIHNFFECLI